MGEANGARLVGRLILIVLTIYALAMIAPDFLRIGTPLASPGLTVNADGRIFEVQGPFASEEDSPAWQAGLRAGDQFDLQAMRCVPMAGELCASTLGLWAGVNYFLPGRKIALAIAAHDDQPARMVTVVAKPRPDNWLLLAIVFLGQFAGVLVVLGGAWLVWMRPGPMTWGFFAYVILFNPGQAFLFYAWLQQWPRLLFAQDVMACILQAAGYTGLLLFALRAPTDRVDGGWRRVERALPALAIVFLMISLSTLGSLFGYRVEIMLRASTLVGFAVSLAAVAILFGRRKHLSPRDYQRIRWVIWGCLIGLPAYLLAELLLETSLFSGVFENGAALEELAGALYIVNGVLCLFVVEAVRRQTIVNVAIPLRRATILGLILSIPTLLLHRQMEVIDHYFHLPEWAWLLIASGLVYLLARLHEFATELAERLFDVRFRRAERHLETVSDAIRHAGALEDIDRRLVEEPLRSLGLASAAVFREADGVFVRGVSAGWGTADAAKLDGVDALIGPRFEAEPYRLGSALYDGRAAGPRVPGDVARPVLAAPIGNPRRCFAVVLYGGHESGTDLDLAERHLLAELTRSAGIAYAQVEGETLRRRVAALEQQLQRAVGSRAVESPS